MRAERRIRLLLVVIIKILKWVQ